MGGKSSVPPTPNYGSSKPGGFGLFTRRKSRISFSPPKYHPSLVLQNLYTACGDPNGRFGPNFNSSVSTELYYGLVNQQLMSGDHYHPPYTAHYISDKGRAVAEAAQKLGPTPELDATMMLLGFTFWVTPQGTIYDKER